MKKKFFLIGALVAMSMSAMFVACSKDDKNGASDSTRCICTVVEYDGNSTTESFSMSDAKARWGEGISSCSAITPFVEKQNPSAFSVSCHTL